MKLWEVIKELTEDPTKKFEAEMYCGNTVRMTVKKGFGGYYNFEVFNGKRLIDQSLGGGAFSGNVALDLDWQPVRQPVRQSVWQPVTWQEAIQAWADGKKVTVLTLFGLGSREVKKSRGSSITEYEITNGTWYVED